VITAALVDSREPQWMQSLTFGGVPTVVTLLDSGDVWAVTDDGHTLMIERKTPSDLLNTRSLPGWYKSGKSSKSGENSPHTGRTWLLLIHFPVQEIRFSPMGVKPAGRGHLWPGLFLPCKKWG
jgi:hypothetical protein